MDSLWFELFTPNNMVVAAGRVALRFASLRFAFFARGARQHIRDGGHARVCGEKTRPIMPTGLAGFSPVPLSLRDTGVIMFSCFRPLRGKSYANYAIRGNDGGGGHRG